MLKQNLVSLVSALIYKDIAVLGDSVDVDSHGSAETNALHLLIRQPSFPFRASYLFGLGMNRGSYVLEVGGLEDMTRRQRIGEQFQCGRQVYRQEQINARSGVHTPRSTLAAWSGRGGAALQPLFDAHREFVLGAQVLHADETPVNMLDPGAGKTKKAYVWAYAVSG